MKRLAEPTIHDSPGEAIVAYVESRTAELNERCRSLEQAVLILAAADRDLPAGEARRILELVGIAR